VAKRGLGRSGVVAEINVTPMADVMLVLLIIFMITTPLLQSGITVNLPKAKNPLDAPDPVGQPVMGDGRVPYDGPKAGRNRGCAAPAERR